MKRITRLIDLTGKRFGRLVVIERICNEYPKNVHWICRCDCGEYSIVSGCNLKNGHTKSCGCHSAEVIGKRSVTHGLSNSRLCRIWHKMKARCFDPNNPKYKDYGARGIKVCEEWKDDLPAFYSWAMANGYSDNLTLDRINNDGNYEPSNCRWATKSEQQNNRRVNHLITHNGETHTLTEWARIVGIPENTLYYRIKRGWSVERALSEPMQKRRNKNGND